MAKAAKAATNKHLTDEDILFFTGELLIETESGSLRAAILVGGSIVDEVLRRALQGFFVDVPSSRELLNGGPNAPLGSFSARIKIAEAVGLISAQEAKTLDVLRVIRNEYAHKLQSEMDSAGMRDRLDSQRELVNVWISDVNSINPGDDFRTTYGKICISMIALLRDRVLWIDERRCTTRPETFSKVKVKRPKEP